MSRLIRIPLFLLCLLTGLASRAQAQTAAAYIATGRGQLANNHTTAGLQAADSAFASALALAPTDPTANVLKSATRLALLVTKPELTALLTALGVSVTDSNPYHFKYTIPKDANRVSIIPPGSTTDLVLPYLNNILLPEVNAAIANLQNVTSTTYVLGLSPQETLMFAANVDYGDVQLMLAGLQGLKSVIALANTQNVSASFPILYDLGRLHELTAEGVLAAFPNLLTYAGTDQRAASKAAFQAANAAYQNGSAFIRTARIAQPGTDNLFAIDTQDAPREERFRRRLAGMSAALNGPTMIDGLNVNLASLLTTSIPARTLLPKLKGNYIQPNTWPDATMAGALPGGTQAILNKGASDAGVLDAPPVVITVTQNSTVGNGGGAYFSPGMVYNPATYPVFSGTLRSGTKVTAIAPAYPGYHFVNWTEGGQSVSTSSIYIFQPTVNRSLVANFAMDPGYYSVTTSATPAPQANQFIASVYGAQLAGTLVTVSAFAPNGYNFVNWTENGGPASTSSAYSFQLNSNRNLVANFTILPGYFTVSASASFYFAGYVNVIDSNAWPQAAYASGTLATASAVAFSGYTFAGWIENGVTVSTSPSYQFPVTGNRSLVASFIPNYSVFAAPSPTPGGSIIGVSSGAVPGKMLLAPGFGLQVNMGADATFTAAPDSGFAVDQWWLDGVSKQIGGSQYTALNVTDNHVVAATFKSTGTAAPIAVTASASGIMTSGTMLNALVSPSGLATTVRFEYGITNAYGMSTANQSIGTGSTSVPVQAAITGLSSNATYHYRVVANNSKGVANGADLTFKTLTPATAQMTGPANGTALPSTTATFIWNAGTGATAYALYVGNSPGGSDIYAKAEGTSLSDTVNNLPVDGRTLYVTLFSYINGQYVPRRSTYTAVDYRARMTGPANGTAMGSTSATFTWSTGTGATAYALYVGSSPGAYDIYAKAEGASLTDTVNNLPVDGRTIYVTLFSYINGRYLPNSYAYTARDNKAQMTSPVNGSALGSSSVSFSWTAGTGATAYALYVGSAPGVFDIYAKAEGASLADTVSIPSGAINGHTLHVRLYSYLNGAWVFNSYTYTAADTKAQMTSPSVGTPLASASATFSWGAGTGVSAYALYVGSSPGVFDLYAKAEGSSLTDTVSNLPTDGRRVYVRLYSLTSAGWKFNAYTYDAFTGSGGPLALLTSPTDGSTFTSASSAFSWNAGVGASAYALYAGRTPGAFDLYAKAEGGSLTDTVTTLPEDGSPVYVTLWSFLSGQWQGVKTRHATTVQGTSPKGLLTSPSPANGSKLTSGQLALTWSAAASQGTQYALYVGSAPLAADIYAKAEGSSLSDTVPVPVDGRRLHVTLWTLINGVWQPTSYYYDTTE